MSKMSNLSSRPSYGSLSKQAEEAAPDEDRIMPSERRYLKSNKTVGVMEAIALMKARRADSSLIIKGGLDDNSQEVRKNNNKRANKGNFDDSIGKSELSLGSQIEAKTDEKQASNDSNSVKLDTIHASSNLCYSNELTPVIDNKGKKTKSAQIIGYLNDIYSNLVTYKGFVTSETANVYDRISSLSKDLSELKTSLLPDKKEDIVYKDILNKFKNEKHRVTFSINGMQFTVRCLDMIKDEANHTLVLAFSDDCDSFFVPPIRSVTKIVYDDALIPNDLFYFGMCFSLKKLGLKFIGFLIDDSSSKSNSENTSETK